MKLRCLLLGAWLGLAGGNALAQTSNAPATATQGEWLRPFDAADYALAYDVLLGAGDLQRAFRVAQKAVQAAPRDRVWRRKLAQVSAWSAHPEVAAEQWLALFVMGERTDDTIANVIALAPQANQPLLALQAWQVYARQHDLTDAHWRDIFALYESTAEPALGADFFEAQFAQRRLPLLLDYAARLAENAADDARAQRLYQQRAELAPFALDSVLRAVVFQIRRDQLAQALELLKRHAHQVPEQAAEFWQLLAQVAWDTGDQTAALQGYQRYAPLAAATSADWVRLVTLLRAKHPLQAADLALQAYQRFGTTDQLLTALSLYAQESDQAAQTRVLAGLGAQVQNIAATEPRFLLWRAQYYQRQRLPDLAWADLRVVMQRLPDDVDVLLSGLWLLIDEHRLAELPALLRAHAQQAVREPRLWGAYAAANQALERQRDALRWYARMVRASKDDPLTLLNYADGLERSGRTGMADRMRRHAWQQLRARGDEAQALLQPGASPELLALTRLSLVNRPGDAAQQLMQRLVRQLRALPDAQPDEQLVQLVLGWAMVKEQFGNAQSWLWRNYARQTQRTAPLWGVAQSALQRDDSQTMARLLARQADALPVYNRYDIASALGHSHQAQSIAFDGMTAQDDAPLHDRYRQQVPQQANYLQWESVVSHGGQLASHGPSVQARWTVAPQWQLLVDGQSMRLGTDAQPLASFTPASAQFRQLTLSWQDTRQRAALALSQHGALEGVTAWRLTYGASWGQRLSIDAGMDYRVASNLSEPMQVAGFESSVFGSVNYTLGRREYGRLGVRWSHYATQYGDGLGSGAALDLEAGYRLRSDYPDWRVRTYLTRQLLTRSTTTVVDPKILPILIPDSSSNWGACLALGDNLNGQSLHTYSRAWRPFGEVCLNHNTLNRTGTSANLGLVGSITGEDHVRVQLENSQASGADSAPVTRLTLRYRHYF